MSSLKLKHSGGNSVSIAGPSSNPAADRTITLNDNYAGDGSFVTANSSGLTQFNGDVQFPSPGSNSALIWDKSEFTLEWEDNVKASWGNSKDLTIYHADGGNSYIEESGGGSLVIKADDLYLQNAAGTENLAVFYEDGGIDFYFNNDITFQTVSGGTFVPASRKIYVGVYNNSNGFANFSDGSGSSTLYIGNQSINTSSDQRLKTNIVDTALDATTKLKQVRVVDFNWNDPSDKAINNKNSRGLWTGTLAQEIVDIFPHAVNAPRPDGNTIDTEDENIWGMEYQHLVPVLIKGFQEQQDKIEVLEAKVAALEAA